MAHSHPVIDADTHFEIDGVTRAVKNVTETKTMLVQFDHNSERFTFKVPRNVDGHDLSLCNLVRVHYINIEKSKRTENSGIYEVTDLAVCPEDPQYVTCSWLVPNTATQLVGSLHFVVQFACEEEGKVLYSWNTARHTSVTVTDGIDCGDAIVSENESILTKWKNQLEANQITKIEQTTFSDDDNGENVWTVTFGDGRTQDLSVKNGSRGSTGLIGSILTLQGHPLHFFVGTKADYEALEDKDNVFAIISDDNSIETLVNTVDAIVNTGKTSVKKAEIANKLNHEGNASYTPQNGKITIKENPFRAVLMCAQVLSDAEQPWENMIVLDGYSTRSANGYYCHRIAGYPNTNQVTFYNSSGAIINPVTVRVREL